MKIIRYGGNLGARLFQYPVLWSGIVTILRVAGSVIVLPVMLKTLPSSEVGLWYVYNSLAGFCLIIEIGFSNIISRFTSFYLAGISGVPSIDALDVAARGNQANFSGILGLMQMARRLYGFFSLMVVLVMALSGLWIYEKYGSTFVQPSHLIAFALMALGTGWSMIGHFWPGMLFGIKRVKEYHQAIFEGILLNYSVVLFGLYFGWGMVSMVLGQVAFLVYQRLRSRGIFLRNLSIPMATESLQIRWQQIWPMTYRGGLMSVGMYLGFGATTMVCAQLFDLQITARYALSLQLVVLATGLANTWVMVRYPDFSTLFLQERYSKIREVFFGRLLLQMSSYVVICLGALWIAPWSLRLLGAKTNFLEPRYLITLMIVAGVDLLENSFCSVIQAGNKFPFVWVKLANGFLSLALAFALGSRLGLMGMICAPLLSQVAFNLWYVTSISRVILGRPDGSETSGESA